MFEDDVPFPKVGYVNFLEGISSIVVPLSVYRFTFNQLLFCFSKHGKLSPFIIFLLALLKFRFSFL